MYRTITAIHSLAATGLIIALTACDAGRTTIVQPSLQGKWVSLCQPTVSIIPGDTRPIFFQETYSIDESASTLAQSFYSDSDCSVSLFETKERSTQTYTGSIVAGGEVMTDTGLPATLIEITMDLESQIELNYATSTPEIYLIQDYTLYFGYNIEQEGFVAPDYRIQYESPYLQP